MNKCYCEITGNNENSFYSKVQHRIYVYSMLYEKQIIELRHRIFHPTSPNPPKKKDGKRANVARDQNE